jgi:hypothetical protein
MHRVICHSLLPSSAASGEVFEIEPGGSEVSGYLLHHLKSE